MKALIALCIALIGFSAFAVDGVPRNIQWYISPTTGQIVGYRNTVTNQDDTAQVSGTLDTAVAKGTWTASGTWTIPDVTLGGTVTGGSQTITGIGTVSTGVLVVTTSASPAATDACTAGKVVWDASYIYVCTATGVWKRAALTGGY